MKRLTPIKAIRVKCIDCSGSELKEIRNCSSVDCPLYQLRMGRGSRAVLKRIRAHCLWCCNGQRDQVRLCPSVKCPLWVYRFGRRPEEASFLPEILTTETVSEVVGTKKGKYMAFTPTLIEGVLSPRKPSHVSMEREHEKETCGNQVGRGKQ